MMKTEIPVTETTILSVTLQGKLITKPQHFASSLRQIIIILSTFRIFIVISILILLSCLKVFGFCCSLYRFVLLLKAILSKL